MSPDLRASTIPKILVALPLPDISSAFVYSLFFLHISDTSLSFNVFLCLMLVLKNFKEFLIPVVGREVLGIPTVDSGSPSRETLNKIIKLVFCHFVVLLNTASIRIVKYGGLFNTTHSLCGMKLPR